MLSHEDFRAGSQRLSDLTDKAEGDPMRFLDLWAEANDTDPEAIRTIIEATCEQFVSQAFGPAMGAISEQIREQMGVPEDATVIPVPQPVFEVVFAMLILGLDVGSARVAAGNLPDLNNTTEEA